MLDLDGLIGRKILFVTGKGGIGKTLTAAVLGRYAVAQGKRVCLIESSARDQISPLFGQNAIGHKLTQLEETLYAINLNSAENLRDFVVKRLGGERVFDRVFNNSIVRSLLALLPALAELTLLGRIFHTSEHKPYGFDLVIVDAYSSGHFLSLMTTPASVMRSGLAGPVLTETQKMIDYMRPVEDCGVLFLTTPEPLVMSECLEFLPKINAAGLAQVVGVGVNRYLGKDPGIVTRLKQTCDDNKALLPACEYILQNFELTSHEVDHLMSATTQLPKFFFRELGAVDEPLTKEFHKQFIQAEVNA